MQPQSDIIHRERVVAIKKTRLGIYESYPNSKIEAGIAEWIKHERDRRILRDKLIDGLTYEAIAEKEEMSPKRVQDIVYAAETKLKKYLSQKD